MNFSGNYLRLVKIVLEDGKKAAWESSLFFCGVAIQSQQKDGTMEGRMGEERKGR